MTADVRALIIAMDQATWGAAEDAREKLVPLGAAIFPVALEVYGDLKGFRARVSLVYTALKFALSEPDAVKLALLALSDRSQPVRYRACMLLAVAGRRETIAALEPLLDHASAQTQADAAAAIAAIRAANHNLFIDRSGSGKVRMNIGGLILPSDT